MLHVVHHVDYMAPRPERGTFKFDKYYLVMEALRSSGVAMTEHAPDPCPREWLEAVHDPDYVEQVFTAQVPREKERRIGFPVTEHIASRVRHTNGGTWLAAQLALAHGYAANSAAGSHHALYDTGAGFCVFNDLAVCANRLIAEGDARRVLILDCDVHQGDGTASLTASICRACSTISRPISCSTRRASIRTSGTSWGGWRSAARGSNAEIAT